MSSVGFPTKSNDRHRNHDDDSVEAVGPRNQRSAVSVKCCDFRCGCDGNCGSDDICGVDGSYGDILDSDGDSCFLIFRRESICTIVVRGRKNGEFESRRKAKLQESSRWH